jgi:hypothetical protein
MTPSRQTRPSRGCPATGGNRARGSPAQPAGQVTRTACGATTARTCWLVLAPLPGSEAFG